MCGRFANLLPADAMEALFDTVPAAHAFAPRWNLSPSQDAAVVRLHPASGERRLDPLQWGLLAHWTREPARARRPINARAETVQVLPTFRDSFARRRCLVPASAFYEWGRRDGAKQPFAIARADEAPLAFAGLWDGLRHPDGSATRSFAIVTTIANASMSAIHPRMPVILARPDWAAWLGADPQAAAGLMRPAPEDALRVWPVGTRVNSPRHDDPSLLDEQAGEAAGAGGANPA